MEKQTIENLGDALYAAWSERRTIQPLIETHPDIRVEDAYRIQERYIARRLAAGETIIGKKIGVTSKPVQDFLGVFEPDFGQLTSGMLCTQESGIDVSVLIQPKAEAELAFVLKHDLVGPGITATDVIAATDYVVPCFEVVDSRINDWKIKIQDTVADNASCGVFILGDTKVDPRSVDLSLAGMAVYRNGEFDSASVGAAVQGSPVNAVAWLANTLGRLGLPFRAGEVILSGSQSSLIPVVAGDELRCTIGGVGSCVARFHGGAK